MSTKRLFLFASFDTDNIVDPILEHYLRALSQLGDVVFVMDNPLPPNELQKLENIPNILYAHAERHGEYDFGSYKRAYKWAREKDILSKYDWIYLVNDSVFGPLFDISKILIDLESRGADFTGLIDYSSYKDPIHIQSWFIGLSKEVACSALVDNFLSTVTAQPVKDLIILRYEIRFSRVLLEGGYKMSAYLDCQNGDNCHLMYKDPIGAMKRGIPFIKKAALDALPSLYYLHPFTTPDVVKFIEDYAGRTLRKVEKTTPETINPSKYRKIFRLTFLSLPLLGIRRRNQSNRSEVSYKLYLFDKIPFMKISMHTKG